MTRKEQAARTHAALDRLDRETEASKPVKLSDLLAVAARAYETSTATAVTVTIDDEPAADDD